MNNTAHYILLKEQYTEYIVDILKPHIFTGFTCIYREAVKMVEEANHPEKTLITFQGLLKAIANWGQSQINSETQRIKVSSGTTDTLDNLVKAVVRANILLLTCSNNISSVISEVFYKHVSTEHFIHLCYIECAKCLHNHSFVFYHDVPPIEYKRNQITIENMIGENISKAIMKLLPLNYILQEFLVNSNALIKPSNAIIKDTKDTKDMDSNEAMEREIMKIVASNSREMSDKEKINQIIKIDKILSDTKFVPDHKYISETKPTNIADLNYSSQKKLPQLSKNSRKDISSNTKLIPSIKKDQQKITSTSSKILSSRNVNIGIDDISFNPINPSVSKSDKDLININFEKEDTVDESNKNDEVTESSFNVRKMPNIKIIEEYGAENPHRSRNKVV